MHRVRWAKFGEISNRLNSPQRKIFNSFDTGTETVAQAWSNKESYTQIYVYYLLYKGKKT